MVHCSAPWSFFSSISAIAVAVVCLLFYFCYYYYYCLHHVSIISYFVPRVNRVVTVLGCFRCLRIHVDVDIHGFARTGSFCAPLKTFFDVCRKRPQNNTKKKKIAQKNYFRQFSNGPSTCARGMVSETNKNSISSLILHLTCDHDESLSDSMLVLAHDWKVFHSRILLTVLWRAVTYSTQYLRMYFKTSGDSVFFYLGIFLFRFYFFVSWRCVFIVTISIMVVRQMKWYSFIYVYVVGIRGHIIFALLNVVIFSLSSFFFFFFNCKIVNTIFHQQHFSLTILYSFHFESNCWRSPFL